MRFIHMADCHLGGWSQPELAELNKKSFIFAVDFAIKEKVDFILVAGDLFDNAYPEIEVIKFAFEQFRKISEARIPVFLIAGSHDCSASGKTFLDVLEKAGFAKNVYDAEEKGSSIYLNPTIYKNVALYGYPGKMSGLEVNSINKIKLHDAPGLYKILMLHTAIKGAAGTLPIPTVDETLLPKVDYLALGHLHIKYEKNHITYSGPTFPNNVLELSELTAGSFYIVDTNGKKERIVIPTREVINIDLQIDNVFTAKDKIAEVLNDKNIEDKVIIINFSGIISSGSKSDLNFKEIEEYIRSKKGYAFLKTYSGLIFPEPDMMIQDEPTESVEEEIINKFLLTNPHKLNPYVKSLIQVLDNEKKEDELSRVFEDRIVSETKKTLYL